MTNEQKKEKIRLLSFHLQNAKIGLEDAKDTLRRNLRSRFLDDESHDFFWERLTGMYFAVKELTAELNQLKGVLV